MPLMKTLRSRHCDGALGKAGTFLRDARVQRLACFWDHARHMPATDSECARRTSPWSYTVHRCSLPICARASRPGRDALTGVDFFGKPLRAIARFSHQDAQTPPSPRVGEGGRGDEGQRRTGLRKITHHSQDLPLRDSPALSTRTTKCHSVTNRRTGAQQDVSPIDGGQMCCYTTHQKKRGTALDRCSPQRRNP